MRTRHTLLTPGGDADYRPPLDKTSLRLLLFLAHTPFGGRVHAVYDRAREIVNDALKRIQGRHPGGRVSTEGALLREGVERHAIPAALETTPAMVRDRLHTVVDETEQNLKRRSSDLEADYLSRQLPWHLVRKRLPYLRKVEDLLLDPKLAGSHDIGPESLFERSIRVMQALDGMPDTVSLDGMLDMQRWVQQSMTEAQQHLADVASGQVLRSLFTDSVQDKLLPALSQTQKEINAAVAPYMVDLRVPKEYAQRLVDAWDKRSVKVPKVALQEGQAGRIGFLEAPHIMTARGLLKKPHFVLFTNAHQFRAQFYKIGRLKGPLIDNLVAEQGTHMGHMVDNAMTTTANRLTPDLEPHWRRVNAAYQTAEETLNSDLIVDLYHASLDDILTGIIRNKRPEDLETLRTVLGRNPATGVDVMDEVAQMWLTRQIEAATPQSTGEVNIQEVLETLDRMPRATEAALFPAGLTALRESLRQQVDMQAAVDLARRGKDADAVELQQLKNRINDPAKWDAVVSDVLQPIFAGGNQFDPINPHHLLTQLNNLGHVKDILFTPAHYEDLTRLAHTARALDQTARAGRQSRAPLVRFIEHGLIVAGLHWMTGGWMAPAGYLIATPVLAHMFATPAIARRLMRGLLSKDVVPILLQAAPAGQERAPGP